MTDPHQILLATVKGLHGDVRVRRDRNTTFCISGSEFLNLLRKGILTTGNVDDVMLSGEKYSFRIYPVGENKECWELQYISVDPEFPAKKYGWFYHSELLKVDL